MSGSTIYVRWEDAATEYAAAATRAGLKAATVSMRTRVLTAFASGLDAAPWELTAEEYQNRLGQLPQSPSRTALRGFYRWALRTGHVLIDPTAEDSKLPQITPAPPMWESALSSFEEAQQASGLQDSTVDLRVRLVRLFAVDLLVPPFQLTWERYKNRIELLEVNTTTKNTYRTAVRAFYRWAHRTGRISEDPTDEPCRTSIQRASPEWEAELLPFQRYLRACGRPETSIKQTVSSVRRIARVLGSTPPYKVTTDDLLEVLAGKSTWQTETRRSHVTSLRSFFRWAKAGGRVKRNPAKALPTVRRSQKVVEPAEEVSIVEALAKASSLERLAIRLAAELGLRRAEVASIHAVDVSGQDGAWWLLVHGKGDKQRRLPVSDGLAHTMRAQGDGFLFPGQDNGHLSPGYLGNRVSDLLPPGVTMHKLRHRFATQAYNLDHDVFTLQKLLGHASPATTERYVRIQDDRGRRLVEFASRIGNSPVLA